jgi:sensor histidine kinase YesM
MMARLGDFLRLTLDNAGTQEVSLAQEVEFLKCYLDIERIRFEKRLTTDFHIDPDALNAIVPNLILQPLVENAILHGVAPRLAPGMILVDIRRVDGWLRINVQDNGAGIPASATGVIMVKEGVGLNNTRSRLERLYGDRASLHLTNAKEGGLIATIELPYVPMAQ